MGKSRERRDKNRLGNPETLVKKPESKHGFKLLVIGVALTILALVIFSQQGEFVDSYTNGRNRVATVIARQQDPAWNQADELKRLGISKEIHNKITRSVVALKIQAQLPGINDCTGTVVSESASPMAILTADHCASRSLGWVDVYRPTLNETPERWVVTKIAHAPEQDAAIMFLTRPQSSSSRHYDHLEIGSWDPQNDHGPFIIADYPASLTSSSAVTLINKLGLETVTTSGQSTYSVIDAFTRKVTPFPIPNRFDATGTNTASASSGAPIIRIDSGQVLAVASGTYDNTTTFTVSSLMPTISSFTPSIPISTPTPATKTRP